MHLLQRIINRLSPRLGKVVETMRTLLGRRGYWRSLRDQRATDSHGNPIPWITYPALDYLSRLDFSQAAVLEYGSGQSSLWWAARARSVTTVESSATWVDELRAQAPANLTVIGPVEDDAYTRPALPHGAGFEVIIIDGLHRFSCAQAALPLLRPGGLMLLDNSDWHPGIAAWLRTQGLVQIDFHGFGPVNAYTWCTSIFIRAAISLPYARQDWPVGSYGSLEQIVEET